MRLLNASRIMLLILILIIQIQGTGRTQEFNLEEWCGKFASLENGGKHLEQQFFLLFGVLESEFPDTELERIVGTTFSIWSDNFKAQGFSNSYYDFLRTFTKQVQQMKEAKDFNTAFKTYCVALLAGAYIPE